MCVVDWMKIRCEKKSSVTPAEKASRGCVFVREEFIPFQFREVNTGKALRQQISRRMHVKLPVLGLKLKMGAFTRGWH